jgi:hypothetical protein
MLLVADGRRNEVKLKKWWSVRALNESLKERKKNCDAVFLWYT